LTLSATNFAFLAKSGKSRGVEYDFQRAASARDPSMTAEILGAVPLAVWCYLLLGRGRFWLARQPETIAFSELKAKRVAAIIPARNEAPVVGKALRSLLAQDYPLQAFLVDDESSDRTTAVAQEVAERLGEAKHLTIAEAGPRPPGWTGKLWAVSQGVRQAGTWNPEYYLLTDADVVHDRSAVAQLVARAESGPYDLVSLMVELRCETVAERALVPAFVFFFFMLYPPEWVKNPERRTAAAAGGCILVRSQALKEIGGIEAIHGELIDDCALARAVKQRGGRLWLGSTRISRSIREYRSWRDIGEMISRSAFTQLRHSVLLLGLTFVAMFVTFLLPIVLLFHRGFAVILGLSAWILMSVAFVPTLRLYRRSLCFAPCLPFIAIFYLGATVHSAIQYWRGKGGIWKGRVQDASQRRTVNR
jgi:hopene-associated glycosyltransferase HpnB